MTPTPKVQRKSSEPTYENPKAASQLKSSLPPLAWNFKIQPSSLPPRPLKGSPINGKSKLIKETKRVGQVQKNLNKEPTR